MSSVLPVPTADMQIDVVDAADHKIGEIERAGVLPEAKNFHTAHLFLFDSDGRLLLQQLAPDRERHALRWGASVAAYLFAGETYEAAIRRRSLQELRITVAPVFVGKIAMIDGQSTKFVSLFTAVHHGPVTADPGHIAAVRYASIEDVEAELQKSPEQFTPTFLRLFAFYREQQS